MNETLSDANVVESNIRLGDAVSTAHMVVSEGWELGTVAAKGLGVLKNVFTLGGYFVRGSGTLGIGGTVIRGVPGTAAGDIVNASIANQQSWTVLSAVGEETASTAIGAGVITGAVALGNGFKATGALANEFKDALSSGQGAMGEAYKAAGALEGGYYNFATRLKSVRAEFDRLGCPSGGY